MTSKYGVCNAPHSLIGHSSIFSLFTPTLVHPFILHLRNFSTAPSSATFRLCISHLSPSSNNTTPQLTTMTPNLPSDGDNSLRVTPSSPGSKSRPSNELDVFSSLTELKPGTIPLLLRMPDGNQSQITVPLTSTVDDLAANLQKDLGTSADDLRFTFGNVDLQPGANLAETNIVDAYEHAGSLLNVIGQGGLDAEGKTAAVNSACAVVESISNGIKDMEALCAAAMEKAFPPQSPRFASLVEQGQAEAERETPKEIDGGEFKMLNNMLSRPDKHAAQDTPQHQTATPSELVYSLSRRMPHIFPTPAVANGQNGGKEDEADEQPALGRRMNSVAQPSLSMIRDARRRARAAAADQPMREEEESAANAMTGFGGSTNGMDVPKENAAVMAAGAKSTWLEDVMKTWEVVTVKESGVLEKSKDGQELNDYFNGLEQEAQREVATAQIDEESDATVHKGAELPGDSEDEEEEDAEKHDADTDMHEHSEHSAEHRPLHTNTHNQRGLNGTEPVGRSMPPTFPMPPTSERRADAAAQMMKAQNAAAAAMFDHAKSSESSQHTLLAQTPSPTPSASSPSNSSAQHAQSPKSLDGSVQSGKQVTTPKPRQATKIAPAPPAHATLSPGMPTVAANGMYGNTMFPMNVGTQNVTWQPPPVRKKRGRKRKNPELTEEERALVRKEQNRESAKLSRVRRKVIAAEYEGRLNALIGENTMLRKQVEGLNNRLVYLQSLLTISVRQEPTSEQRLQPNSK